MLVSDVMSRYVVRVSYDDSAFRAAELMRRNKIGVLPVLRGNSVVGVVTDRDIITRCVALGKPPLSTTVDSIMTSPAVCVEVETPLAEAMEQMARKQIKRVPVLSGGRLSGMLSLCDLPGKVSGKSVAGTYQQIFTPGAGSDSGPSVWSTLFD